MEVAGSLEGMNHQSVAYHNDHLLIYASPTVHGPLVEDLARQTGAAVVFPYYTPAPEKQYPVQFEESFAVLKYIVENGTKHKLKTETVALAGDSVGGKIATPCTIDVFS